MSAIKLDPAIKEAMVARLQTYLADELDIKLGGFDASFFWTFSVSSWAVIIIIRD